VLCNRTRKCDVDKSVYKRRERERERDRERERGVDGRSGVARLSLGGLSSRSFFFCRASFAPGAFLSGTLQKYTGKIMSLMLGYMFSARKRAFSLRQRETLEAPGISPRNCTQIIFVNFLRKSAWNLER